MMLLHPAVGDGPRRAGIVLLCGIVIAAANYGAFWLRFDGTIPDAYLHVWRNGLPWAVALGVVILLRFRVFDGPWKYTGLWDLRNVGLATLTWAALVWAFDRLLQWGYPQSIHPLAAVLTVAGIGSIRMAGRQLREAWRPHSGSRRVLVYGAGGAGEMIVRDMKLHDRGVVPVGFVDDDGRKTGHRIHGIPVLGTREEIAAIIAHHHPQEILIAMPSVPPQKLREVMRALEPFTVAINTLPRLQDLVARRVDVTQVRRLQMEDLLARAPVDLDARVLRRTIAGRRVLVTGAGGSIGSELCRQIARVRPASLVLVDRYENSLSRIHHALADRWPERRFEAVIADITDAARLDAVFEQHRPEVVFHAAAHKHLPLMEDNPCEAVKNNVAGTRLTAEAADRHGVDRFVLISTDKAVNPTSVMGATKRVAELAVHAVSTTSRTRFVTVRFGNVFGSNGSAVPRFIRQIRRGGPVTVTHPEVTRYFMSIPEAVQLVMHAATFEGGTGIYVLDMGDPIKIVDIARNLIRLAGYIPEDEIAIAFTGLRPGEKLHEELVGTDETAEGSGVPRIMRVRPAGPLLACGAALAIVTELEARARAGDAPGVIQHMCTLVPTFTPARLTAVA